MCVCSIFSQNCTNIMNIVASQLRDRETASLSYCSTPPILTLPSDATHTHTHTCLHRNGQEQTVTLVDCSHWKGVGLDSSQSTLHSLRHSHCNLPLCPAPVPVSQTQAAVPGRCQGPPVSRMRAQQPPMTPSVCAGSSVPMREPQRTAVLRQG